IDAAREYGIPTERLSPAGLIQLGHGHKQRRFFQLTTDRTPLTAVAAAQDTELAETLLKSVQVIDRDALQGDLYRLMIVDGRVAAAVLCAGAGETATTTDAMNRVGSDATKKAVAAAQVLGLDIAGVDVQAVDLRAPLIPQKGGIVKIHAQPDLATYLASPELIAQTAKAIVDYLFPTDDDGRIPIACVTGVNGKTTTTRLLAQMVAGMGLKTGMTCTDGVFLGNERIEAADCSGPKSARLILRHPEMEAGVFEVARGGILREGLGFDRADVSIVTNIGEGDHLGINYIDTAEQLAYVKSTVIDAVREQTGTAVLNAADPLTVGMQKYCRGKTTFFALDPQNETIVAHRAAGGTAFFVRDNQVIAAEGEQETPIIALTEVPLTRGGRIGFQIENVLAATAAAWALKVPPHVLRAELRAFDSDMAQTPGRFNVLEKNGTTIILDYGHNPSAIVSLIASLDQFPHSSRTVVYGADGDRSDEQIKRQAELLGDAFDRAILYEEPSRRRGREPNVCYTLLEAGLAKGKRVQATQRIDGEFAAIEAAIQAAKPGELLLIQVDAVDADLAFIERLLK
ncbi:MAG TPA: Mur ligase family protein, partial [Pirellulaceae bacterium]|nr:Mur ligase family protein [Pirellulaceae bacterium]